MFSMSACLPLILQAPIADDGPSVSPIGRWQLGNAQAGEIAVKLNAVLAGDEFSTPGVEILRQRKGRTAMRIAAEGKCFFAKRIELGPIRKRIGAALGVQNRLLGFDHGAAELRNTLHVARTTGMAVEPLALGTYRRHGFPIAQILVQPWLEGYQMLGEAWQSADRTRRYALLEKLQELIRRLHHARICHLDFNPTNVMVPEHGVGEAVVIDCARLVRDVRQPDVASALQIGKMLRSLYGRREIDLEARLDQARAMLESITNTPPSTGQDALLLLALRYQLGKTISLRHLVSAAGRRVDIRRLEAKARRSYKNAELRSCPAIAEVLLARSNSMVGAAHTASPIRSTETERAVER